MGTRNRAQIVEALLDPGIVVVVRALSSAQVVPLSQALLRGGVVAVEITMTTPGAIEAIRTARRVLPPEALVGVGTVLDIATAEAALEAGAEFVVTPICRTELVQVAHAAGKPVMIGAYTPTEAQRAHEAGADFVKLFPADNLGPGYIKALRAPLPHLRIVPTGGVTLETIGAFFAAGCAAVGTGSSLLSPAILKNEDWTALTRLAASYVEAARIARGAALAGK
jgi:2-dehydro-3-deoxyphosphogluconate aldolase/(4S)-4-hydroxy-2-oxoglutarate aldolase